MVAEGDRKPIQVWIPSPFQDDLKMLVEINNMGFKLFNTLSVGERKDYTISYDFHIGNKRLVNHKLTPLVLSKDGRFLKQPSMNGQ